jgi:hypothetical protein
VGFPDQSKTQYFTHIRVRLIPRTKERWIANPLGIFGPILAPRGMFLCCKFPLLDVEDDARMLEIQGEVWRSNIEATMEDLDALCFSKMVKGEWGRGGRN